jgi:hypothetical protein
MVRAAETAAAEPADAGTRTQLYRERDGHVAVGLPGVQRAGEIGDAHAEVFGREGQTLPLMLALLLLSPGIQ